jgi:hypothetical protein
MRVKTEEGHHMQFVLTGFRHDAGSRVFAFEGIAADRTRVACSVSADLALSRRHGIRVQELPLMCMRLLELEEAGEGKRHLAFNEEDMRQYMDNCVAEREAARKKRVPRRPSPTVVASSPWTSPWPRV